MAFSTVLNVYVIINPEDVSYTSPYCALKNAGITPDNLGTTNEATGEMAEAVENNVQEDPVTAEATEAAVAEVKESSKEEQTFASLIASGTVDHISEIDEMIKSHLTKDWSLERINKVTLAILRTSIYEMKFQNFAQSGIVIDEAVNIAKNYGPDDSYKFVNAILDKIGKDEKSE